VAFLPQQQLAFGASDLLNVTAGRQ